MAEIEFTITITATEEADDIIDKPTMKTIEQMRKDKELLAKIQKYGMFDENGEWMQ